MPGEPEALCLLGLLLLTSARTPARAGADGNPVALADSLGRLGRTSDAAGEVHAAVTLASSQAEQRLLQDRLRKLRPEPG